MKRAVTYRLYKKTKTSVINTTLSLVLLATSFGGAVPLFLSQKAFAATPTVVNSLSTQGWTSTAPADTRANGHVALVADGTAPLGLGALSLKTDASPAPSQDKAQFMHYLSSPISLSSVTGELSYYTKQNSASFAAGDPSYQIPVFLNGSDGGTNFATLVYEPYVDQGNAAVQNGVWQNWNVGAGKFWSSKTFTGQGGSVTSTQGSETYTLDQLKTYFPNAQVLGYGVNLGSNNPGYDTEVDGFVFNDDAYNFDPVVVPACSSDDTTFDTFSNGSVNGQHGWASTGGYDQSVVDNTYSINSFGCKSLRLSNAVASGSFGDQTFSYSTANEAGESDSTNSGQSGGTRQDHYEAQFDVASTSQSQQPGLSLSVSPDRGDGSRMSYLRLVDQSDGVHVFFDDVQGTGNPANFVETEIATLSRTAPHTLKFVIDYVNGPSNDVVKVYVDGSLVHTGTTWENYYRYDSESSAEQSPRTSDSLLFRAGGSSVPANSGNGFLFDNVSITTSTTPPPATPTNLRFENPYTACGGYTNINYTSSTWDAVPGAVGYDYHVEGPNGLVYDANVVGTSNSGSFGAGVEGTYSFQVRSVNGLGVKSAWSAFCGITYDATAPIAIQNLSPTDGAVLGVHDFNFDWTDSTDTNPVTYKWEASLSNATNADGGFTNVLASHTLTSSEVYSPGTPDDVYYWHVKALDAAGNASAWTTTWKVTVDTNAPATPTNLSWKTSSNVTIANGGITNLVGGTALWEDSSSDVDHYVYRYWNDIPGNPYKVGSEYTTNAGGTSLAGVFNQGEGVHHFTVQAVDAAGNASAISDTFTITYDATAPTGLANSSPADGTVTTTAAQLLITWTDAADANGPVKYYYESSTSNLLNGDGSFLSPIYQSGALSDNEIPTPGTPAGTYYWHVRAVDAAGNSTDWTGAWKIVIDNTAPVVTVDTLSTTDTTPIVTGTVNDSDATVQVTVNGQQYTATVTGNTWTVDVTAALAAGSYDVSAVATDVAGNTGTDTTTNELTITAPVVLGDSTTTPPKDTTVVVTSSNSQNANTGNANNSGNGSTGDAQSGDANNENNTNINASVLGASTEAEDTDNNVKTFADASAKDSKFLGLGYWWILIILALAGFFWFLLAAKRRNQDEA